MKNNTIKDMIADFERDLLGNWYTLHLSNGDAPSFTVEKKNVPHLLGVRKLPLRQAQRKSALVIYDMLRDGRINLDHIASHKEAYKKLMNFPRLVSILHCGDAVKIVKRIGTLRSQYLLFLDHRPQEIIHLGLVKDESGIWHPESFLILQRNVTTYIDGQIPVDIISMIVSDTMPESKMINNVSGRNNSADTFMREEER
jgi:hypothetical protein